MYKVLESKLPAEQPEPLLELWAWILERAQGYYMDENEYMKLLGMLPVDPALLIKWERVCQILSQHGASFAQSLLAAGKTHLLSSQPSA